MSGLGAPRNPGLPGGASEAISEAERLVPRVVLALLKEFGPGALNWTASVRALPKLSIGDP
jgi:hypothetical protein